MDETGFEGLANTEEYVVSRFNDSNGNISNNIYIFVGSMVRMETYLPIREAAVLFDAALSRRR